LALTEKTGRVDAGSIKAEYKATVIPLF